MSTSNDKHVFENSKTDDDVFESMRRIIISNSEKQSAEIIVRTIEKLKSCYGFDMKEFLLVLQANLDDVLRQEIQLTIN